MVVKICGITNLEDAQAAVEAGADALGFNFWRPGKRYIAPEAAGRIIEQLPRRIMKVGVFVDEEPGELRRIAREAGLSVAQLHGSETAEYVERLRSAGGLELWKAFRVDEQFRSETLADYAASAFLLDGAGPAPGGNARAFDWSRAREASRFGRVMLAGGLHADNVAAAIRTAAPWGVDTASGVESAPGKKDAARVRRFVEAAREAEA